MLHTDCVPVAVLSVLARLRDHSAMDGFHLAGGTSLALRFGHRVSVDLDYFTDREFDSEALAAELAVLGGSIVNRAPNSLTLNVEGVKVDLLRHAYRMLDAVEERNGIRLAGVRDGRNRGQSEAIDIRLLFFQSASCLASDGLFTPGPCTT